MSTNMTTILKTDNLVSFTWQIDNFSTREEKVLKSDKIGFPDRDYELNVPISRLLMGLRERSYNGEGQEIMEMSICLTTELSYSKSVPAVWRIAILNARGEKCSTQEKLVPLGNKSACNDCRYAKDRAHLFDPQNGLLVNDKLTIYCEMEIIDDDYVKCSASMAHDYGELLESTKFSDVVLVVGGEELKAHKAVLSTRSKVFSAIFEHDCEEKRNSRVVITDLDKEVFQEFLRYIYTGKVRSLELYAADLMVAADKYQLDPLKCICEHYLAHHLTAESACQILILADSHQFNKLKEKCVEYITDYSKDIKLADWKAICESNLELAHRLFQRD